MAIGIAAGNKRDVRFCCIRQGKYRLAAGGPALQFDSLGARRRDRTIKNSPRAAKRSDCFHP